MPRHLLIGVLIGLVASSGCGGPRLVVRSARGDGARVDPSKQFIPLQYDREEVHEAVEPYANLLAALVRQHDGQLRIRLSSEMASGGDAADRQFLEEYLSWCGVTRGSPGDCLDARDPRMPGLTVDGKRGIALRMAFSSAMHEAAEVVRGINPVKVEAMLLIWFAFYLASFVIPEPVTKALDVLLTANLIAFLGVDGFHSVLGGYLDMRKDAEAAKDFDALHEAGQKYGRQLGPSMLRIVTALITWGLAARAGVGTAAAELPGGDLAAWNAEAQGFELASVSGGSVTVSSAGTVTLTVASVATRPERGGSAPKEKASTTDPKAEPCPDYPTCGAGVVYKGQDGEAAVRAVADIGEKKPIFINDRWRIPDGVTRRVLTEVKNVRYLAFTRQLHDLLDFARQEGLRFDLWVPKGEVDLSGPLQEAIANKQINLRRIP